MGRAKLYSELITKEKSRNSTYFKRKQGLRKNLHEFKTLCGVDTLMIAYGPKQGDHPIEVETFPPELEKVNEIIKMYQKVSEEDKVKRTLTLKNFFEDQKRKSTAELVKLRKKNQELYLNVKKELVEQRIKSIKAMNSRKKIVEFLNSIVRDQIRRYILHSQPFGYPLPAMEYHHLNNNPTTKEYPTDHENHSMISKNGTPRFTNPIIGTYDSNYGYLNMGINIIWITVMQINIWIPPGVSFQRQQHQLQFMNTSHHQHQFISSGSSSQMHHQSASSHFGFQDQTNN
ncbi:hypothetical protein MKW92_015906 [Papaver armeniacum]|nr:hypothetical protein MKW92_015906 [Papaver armeniacum]